MKRAYFQIVLSETALSLLYAVAFRGTVQWLQMCDGLSICFILLVCSGAKHNHVLLLFV